MDLLEAITQKNLKQVRKILENDHSVNINDTVRNREGQNVTTPLVWACQGGDKATVDMLLQLNADVNKQTQCADGLTPLYVACEDGDMELVKMLLSKGAYVDTQVRLNKMSPLHIAIRNGHVKIVETLLQCEADVDVVSNTGTPLYEAVSQGTTQVAKMLLERGANVNKTSPKTNETALHKCVAMDYVGMTRLLVESDADPSIKMTNNLYTPICVAVEQKNKNCVQYLLNLPNVEIDVVTRDHQTPLGIAAQCDNVEIMKTLIQAGADINFISSIHADTPCREAESDDDEDNGGGRDGADVTSPVSLTPLMIAAKYGHRRGIELLLQKGASPNIRNGDGNTALHYAVFDDPPGCKDEKKMTKICTLLLRGRASPNVKNCHGVSPFYYAVRRRMLFMLEPFLASGADANSGDQNESSAFHFLADHAPSYGLLAKYRADVNKQNAEGRTPVHIAAASYDTTENDLALLFKEFRTVDSTTLNYDGELPVHLTKKIEIVDFFRRHQEADLTATTWSGDTLLHCMIKNRLPTSDIKKALKWKCFDTNAVNSSGQTALELSKLMLNSEVFRVLDEDKREKDTTLHSPRKMVADKKQVDKMNKKPTININKKPRSNSNKKEAPTYLKPTENQQNRISDDTDSRKWNTNLRGGKISDFQPLLTERKASEGGGEIPSYAKATENLVNKQNDLGEYEHKDWSKNFLRNESGKGGGDGGKDNKRKKENTGVTEEKQRKNDATKIAKNEELNDNNKNNNNKTEPQEESQKSDCEAGHETDATLREQQQQETNRSEASGDGNESSPRKDDRTLSFGDDNNNDELLPSPTQSEEELAEIFGKRRKRFCSFYDSPTSGEDEVLYDGYDNYIDGNETSRRKSQTKICNASETGRKNDQNACKIGEQKNVADKSDSQSKVTETNNTKVIGENPAANPSVKTKKPATSKANKMEANQAENSYNKAQKNKGKPTPTKTSTATKNIKAQNKGKPTETKTVTATNKILNKPEGRANGGNTNRTKKAPAKTQKEIMNNTNGKKKAKEANGENGTATTVNQKTPRHPEASTSPRKQPSQDEKSDVAESKFEFCDVAVIVDDDDTSQKADQICEYIKRRGRVFVARQPHFTSQNKEEKDKSLRMTKENEDFRRMLKQAKIVLILVSETLKTSHTSLELCAYADRLNKLAYPLLLEGKKTRYESSCLLDLMLGDKQHYEVGIHYEQEMEKALKMIKDKMKT